MEAFYRPPVVSITSIARAAREKEHLMYIVMLIVCALAAGLLWISSILALRNARESMEDELYVANDHKDAREHRHQRQKIFNDYAGFIGIWALLFTASSFGIAGCVQWLLWLFVAYGDITITILGGFSLIIAGNLLTKPSKERQKGESCLSD